MNCKRWIALAIALMTFGGAAAHLEAAVRAPRVPENIFRWVQSSDRTNYFFNKQQICFKMNENNEIDTNLLIVPVLKTLDDVMIEDVIAKRRWNGKSTRGFNDFVAVSEYLMIDLAERKVYVQEVDYLDSTWTTIEAVKSDAEVSLEELSEKNWEARFYDRIIDFAMRNQLVLANRTKGDLSEEVKAELAKAQEEYRAGNPPDRPEDNE